MCSDHETFRSRCFGLIVHLVRFFIQRQEVVSRVRVEQPYKTHAVVALGDDEQAVLVSNQFAASTARIPTKAGLPTKAGHILASPPMTSAL